MGSHDSSSATEITEPAFFHHSGYGQFCTGGRRPGEKLQVWGTLMPNAAAFPIPPWAPAPRGNGTQHCPSRTGQMQTQLGSLLASKQLSPQKENWDFYPFLLPSTSCCQQTGATL